MNSCFNGLGFVNVELTSRCNKDTCWMCGRRKIEQYYPELVNWGDMKFELVEKIAEQLPIGIVVQLHSDGEPTVYPRLYDALQLFKKQIRQFDTNGKLIVKKADEIIDNLDVLTISVIQDDSDGDEQYEIVKQFLDLKGDRQPTMVYRLLGHINNRERWTKLPGVVANRTIHNPMGSFKYKKNPTIPEIGVCLDLLHHLVIDRFGNAYPCVRFNPKKFGIIGNVNDMSLLDIWNSKKRQLWIKHHLEGNRNNVSICRETRCEFWGCPTSP